MEVTDGGKKITRTSSCWACRYVPSGPRLPSQPSYFIFFHFIM